MKKELLILGILAILVFSGCTSPKEETENNLTTGQTYSDDEKYPALIKSLLSSDAGLKNVKTEIVDLTHLDAGKTLLLSYDSSTSTEIELAEESGYVLGSFIGAVKSGWNIDGLNVIVNNEEGETKTWYSERTWVDAYLNGTKTMDWLTLKSVGSMTTANRK